MRTHRSNKERDTRMVAPVVHNDNDVPPAPEGYVYRWIRTRILEREDTKNIGRRFGQQKWEPVKSDEVPDSWWLDVASDGRFQGCVQNGDRILGKNLLTNVLAIRQAQERRSSLLEQGIRSRLRTSATEKMPFIEDEDFETESPSRGRRVNLED
mgnify:CR=1 FL=1